MENIGTIVFNMLFSQGWWFIALLIAGVLFTFLMFVIKNKFTKSKISRHVEQHLSDDYILLNHCKLPHDRLGLIQIEHLLISPYGVFLIEIQPYKGLILGGVDQPKWTQQLNQKSHQFANPLHQNFKHEALLKGILEDLIAPEFIHSVIVFIGDGEFKTDMPEYVFRGAAWLDYVKTFDVALISNLAITRIQSRIEKEVLEKSWQTNRIHLENLKKRKHIV